MVRGLGAAFRMAERCVEVAKRAQPRGLDLERLDLAALPERLGGLTNRAEPNQVDNRLMVWSCE
jgi:hypothetical protein